MKKLISALLCAVLLLGLIPVGFSAKAAQLDLSAIPDGGTYVDSKGTEYTVLRSADTILNIVKANMAGNYILGNDIDFNNKRFYSYMFNSDGAAFSGVFDGNGYAIKNFYTTANFNAKAGLLFGGLTGNAKIRNLTVGGEGACIPFSITSTGATVIGGLAGYTVPGAKVVISNVKVYADISFESVVQQSVFVGGLIGQTDPITIMDSEFHGSIRFTETAKLSEYVTIVGGIVARCNQEGELLSILNCKNYADIDVTNRTIGEKAGIKTVVGGILGSSDYSFTVRNCENHGQIKGDKTVGGIVGEIVGKLNTENSFEMIGCRNYGDVIGEIYVAGILGLSAPNSTTGASTAATYSISILNCFNAADITAKTEDSNYLASGNSGAAGIAGRINRGYLTIQNCGSVGNVSGTGRTGTASATSNALFGIIVINADAERLSVIADCYAVGTLTPLQSNYAVYGTGAVYTDRMIYLPFISNCHYNLTATQGTLKSIALTQSITENYGDYTYSANGAVTAEEVANGALLAKLGDGFAQTVGTDPYPIPVQPEYTYESETENLFLSSSEAGYYGEGGAWVSDQAYATKNNLALQTGDVVTVGAMSTEQASFGYLFDQNKTPVKKLSLSDMTLVSDLGNGYGIYSYTATADVAYMSVTVYARRAYITMLTLNEPFDAEAFYSYFGISPMKGSAQSPLWQKSALYLGDSICYGFDDVATGGRLRAYGGRIGYDYDMEWVNAGVSGATLSTVSGRKRIVDQMEPYKNQEFDYVIIEGGINDALNQVEIGSISRGLYAGLDFSTYAGALEQLFRETTRNYPNAKVGFLITYQCPRNNSHPTYVTYQEITKEICEKWDVAYLDMFAHDEINNTVLESSNRNSIYMPDGIHPSAEGYDRLAPYISAFMETASVPVPNANYGDTENDNKDDQNNDNQNNNEDQNQNDNSQNNGTTDSTPNETDTASPADTTVTTDADTAQKSGCGAQMQLSALSLMVILAFAMATKKEKHI